MRFLFFFSIVLEVMEIILKLKSIKKPQNDNKANRRTWKENCWINIQLTVSQQFVFSRCSISWMNIAFSKIFDNMNSIDIGLKLQHFHFSNPIWLWLSSMLLKLKMNLTTSFYASKRLPYWVFWSSPRL